MDIIVKLKGTFNTLKFEEVEDYFENRKYLVITECFMYADKITKITKSEIEYYSITFKR